MTATRTSTWRILVLLTAVGLWSCQEDALDPAQSERCSLLQSAIVVGAECSDADFTTIQSAVNAAGPGELIVVSDGTYGKVDIPSGRDGLTLMSASHPVIDCGGVTGGVSVGNGITIDSNGVTIDGFEIKNCTNGIQGTSVNSTEIRNNDIHDNRNPSSGFGGVGIAFNGDSDDNIVENNTIHDNDRQGIFLGGSCGATTKSERNKIYYNTIFDNGKDLLADPASRGPDASQYGIQLCDADDNVVSHNEISGHNEWSFGIGIYLFNSDDNVVYHNELNNNRLGIVLFGDADDNDITQNEIKDGVAPTCDLSLSPPCNPVTTNKLATGIRIFDAASSGNTIDQNEMKDNAGSGVDIVSGNTVDRNEAKGNDMGGYLIRGSANSITDNESKDNTGDGFKATSGNNTFSGNEANANSGFGFRDTTAGTDNTYADNECKGNTAGGSDPTGLCSP